MEPKHGQPKQRQPNKSNTITGQIRRVREREREKEKMTQHQHQKPKQMHIMIMKIFTNRAQV